MDAILGDVDELVEFCPLLDEDRALLSGKHGATCWVSDDKRGGEAAIHDVLPIAAGSCR